MAENLRKSEYNSLTILFDILIKDFLTGKNNNNVQMAKKYGKIM